MLSDLRLVPVSLPRFLPAPDLHSVQSLQKSAAHPLPLFRSHPQSLQSHVPDRHLEDRSYLIPVLHPDHDPAQGIHWQASVLLPPVRHPLPELPRHKLQGFGILHS